MEAAAPKQVDKEMKAMSGTDVREMTNVNRTEQTYTMSVLTSPLSVGRRATSPNLKILKSRGSQ